MQLPIKGRREKESISEIQSKPTPADVTAKTAYIPSVCTVVQNRRRPPVSQPESCHLRPNERSQKSGTDFETSRPGTLRLGRTEPYRRLRIRPYPPQGRIPTLPHRSDASGASVGTASPTTGGAERLRSAIRRMYKRAGADKGIVPLSYRRRDHARALPFAERAVASAQASEQHPQQQRTVRPCSAIRRMYERAGADKGIVPLACRKRAERPRSAIRRTSGRVRASVGTTSPTATGKRPCSAIFRVCNCFGGGRIRPSASLPQYPPRREDEHPFPLRFGKPDL